MRSSVRRSAQACVLLERRACGRPRGARRPRPVSAAGRSGCTATWSSAAAPPGAHLVHMHRVPRVVRVRVLAHRPHVHHLRAAPRRSARRSGTLIRIGPEPADLVLGRHRAAVPRDAPRPRRRRPPAPDAGPPGPRNRASGGRRARRPRPLSRPARAGASPTNRACRPPPPAGGCA